MRLILAALLALAGLAALAAEPPQKDDLAAVQACLDLAAKAAKAAPPQDLSDEAAGPEGRLAAAVATARGDPASCIGAAAAACLRAREEASSNAALIECYSREAAVWDWRLNAAYRTALARMDDAAAADLRKTQRIWILLRSAMCAQPDAIFKGTMAGPMRNWCWMDLTARQAIWMQGWTLDEGN